MIKILFVNSDNIDELLEYYAAQDAAVDIELFDSFDRLIDLDEIDFSFTISLP